MLTVCEHLSTFVISRPEHVVVVCRKLLNQEHQFDREKEHIWILGLTTQNTVQYVDLVYLGTLNQAPVHPREIFRHAILEGAHCIILAHNHPSGFVEPSDSDKNMFNRLKEAGKVLGIELLDSIIMTHKNSEFHSAEGGIIRIRPKEFT